ncbi:MAG: VWA domain-containing protein [Rikenellaceae bacterium]|jgi:Ca-activated chloride channel family protein|nr:VWA domain-containing protein [Rikenellaceae bacterium]
MFRFESPEFLLILAAIPLLATIFVLARIGARRRLARFGNPTTLRPLMSEASPRRVRNKFILLAIAIGLVVAALARPQFGSKLRESTSQAAEIILAVDVSNSMLAEDFSPNRLEQAKYAITRLLGQMTKDRIGLVVFAGKAYVQLPLTADYTTARNFVKNLSPTMVSHQGTAIGAAIDLAATSFSSGTEESRALIIISDGENHEDDVVTAARRASETGIRIYTIGMGTPEGAPLRIGGQMLHDEEGNLVVSKLDEKTLEEIAITTGGAYIRASNQSVGLNEIVTEIDQMEKKRATALSFSDFNDQFPHLLWGALALLLIEFGIIPRKNRILTRFNIFR